MADGSVVADIKAILRFLKSLWGVLTGASLFFPTSNVLFEVIPTRRLPVVSLDAITSKLLTAIATLFSLFSLFAIIHRRHKLRKRSAAGDAIGDVFMLFSFGVVCLGAYLVIYVALLSPDHFESFYSFLSVICVLSYAGFFALMTAAFSLLGLLEYLHENKS